MFADQIGESAVAALVVAGTGQTARDGQSGTVNSVRLDTDSGF